MPIISGLVPWVLIYQCLLLAQKGALASHYARPVCPPSWSHRLCPSPQHHQKHHHSTAHHRSTPARSLPSQVAVEALNRHSTFFFAPDHPLCLQLGLGGALLSHVGPSPPPSPCETLVDLQPCSCFAPQRYWLWLLLRRRFLPGTIFFPPSHNHSPRLRNDDELVRYTYDNQDLCGLPRRPFPVCRSRRQPHETIDPRLGHTAASHCYYHSKRPRSQ